LRFWRSRAQRLVIGFHDSSGLKRGRTGLHAQEWEIGSLIESGNVSKYAIGQVKSWLAALLACCAAAAPQAPRAAEQRANVFGRVLDAETHAVVRRAAVKVYTSKDQWDVFTDDEGRFRFSELTPGDCTLIAHRDSYSDRAYKVERSDFEEQKELLIELHRQGVIAGRIVDGFGQAAQGANVQALSARSGGEGLDVVGSAETNDLGEYRLSGLDPGTYQVRATYREGRNDEFDPLPLTVATSYYGGAEKPAGIAVKAGSLITGIDFVLNPARPITLRGVLRSETGVLADPATLWIMGQSGEGGRNATGRDGKFEIADVGPGTYTISAQTLDKTAPLFGIVTVEVRDAELDGIDLMLRPAPRIDAEIKEEGGGVGDLKLV